MSKTFWGIIAAIIVVFGGLIIFNKQDGTVSNAEPTSHIVGASTTGVSLVEYGDFQCPYCSSYYPLIEQIKEKYGDQISFQFRHLPLLQIHPNALAAAKASEAAHNQGKFWEMYSLLFQNQTAWSENDDAKPIFEQYATQLNLDMARFRADAASSAVNDTINADINEFKKTNEAMSTPTFFLDGKKITATSLDEFSTQIDAAIAAKQPAEQPTE